jgi:two-component system chemotaxis response regulator CheY
VRIEQPSAAFSSAFDDLNLDLGTVESAPEEAPEPAPASEEAGMAKRILTIDDSKTIRDMLRLTLLDAGFEVLQAIDGQDGIEVLAKEPVDIVITDINMPKMDGYGVIRHMRADAAHKSTPVLVLTTESEVEKRNLAREAGATGWMVKPFDPDRLIATINKVAP